MTLTAEQLKAREGVGASMVGTIVGANKYASPTDIWEELTGRRPRFVGNLATRIGTAAEPVIAQEYAAANGCESCARIVATGEDEAHMCILRQGETVKHAAEPWAFATPDRYVVAGPKAGRLLELKTAGFAWKEGLPKSYEYQLQWQMLVTGQPVADLFVIYLGTRKTETFTVAAKSDDQAALLHHCRRFWFEHVLADVPPHPRFPLENL